MFIRSQFDRVFTYAGKARGAVRMDSAALERREDAEFVVLAEFRCRPLSGRHHRIIEDDQKGLVRRHAELAA